MEIREHRSEGNSWEEMEAVLRGAMEAGDAQVDAQMDAAMARGAAKLRAAAKAGDMKVAKELVRKKGGREAGEMLLWAARRNQLDILEMLLAAGANPNWAGEMKLRPLVQAAEFGHLEAVRMLLAAGADPKLGSMLDTPLGEAMAKGHKEIVGLLLEKGATIDAKGREGEIFLKRAVRAGNGTIVRLLLEMGADVNVPDGFGRTVLIDAAERGNVEMVRMLLKAGAAVDRPRPMGPEKKTIGSLLQEKSTALIEASKEGHLEVVRELVDAGADLLRTDGVKLTAYDWAMKNGHRAVGEELKKAGGAKGKPAATVAELLVAAQAGDVAGIDAALAAGVPVDGMEPHLILEEGNGGMTALMVAAKAGQVRAVERLIEAGADPEAISKRGDRGKAALVYAAEAGQGEAARMLLQAVSQKRSKARAEMMRAALRAAAKRGDLEMAKLLVKGGANVDEKEGGPLHDAAENGHAAMVAFLLEAGAAVDEADQVGTTALINAALGGHVEAARRLIEHGANVNAATGDWSALSAAAMGLRASRTVTYGKNGKKIEEPEGDAMGVLRLLVEAGADVAGDKKALIRAAAHPEGVKFLLAHGAKVNSAEDDGCTALWWAAGQGALESVKLLVEAGADVNAVTKSGQTALDVATLHHLKTVKACLEKAGALPGAKLPSAKVRKANELAEKKKRQKEEEAVQKKLDALKAKFVKAAKGAEFKKLVAEFEKIGGGKSMGDEESPSIRSIETTRSKGKKLVEKHQAAFLKKGAYLYCCGGGVMEDDPDLLALAPTTDKFEVMMAMGTGDPNGGKEPLEVIEELRAIEKEQPFTLWLIRYDRLEGQWTRPIQKPAAFAKRLYALCSDIVSQGVGTVEALAAALRKSRTLYFWWD